MTKLSPLARVSRLTGARNKAPVNPDPRASGPSFATAPGVRHGSTRLCRLERALPIWGWFDLKICYSAHSFVRWGYTLATVLCAGGPSSFGLDWTAGVYPWNPGDLPDSDNLSFGVIPLTYYVCKVVLFCYRVRSVLRYRSSLTSRSRCLFSRSPHRLGQESPALPLLVYGRRQVLGA